jgi:hypothetical protein
VGEKSALAIEKSRLPTRPLDAVKILHRRYYEGKPQLDKISGGWFSLLDNLTFLEFSNRRNEWSAR